MRNQTILELQGVAKSYETETETIEALKPQHLKLARGDSVALMGPSGSGKSTLLRIAGLVESPESGSVRINGVNAGALRLQQRRALRGKAIGFMFQSDGLIEELTAVENVALPLMIAKMSKNEALGIAGETLAHLKLERLKDRLPSRLSGGERQRVALCRAIVTKPDILIADEPTGALDLANTRMAIDLIEACIGSRVGCVLLATHDPEVAQRMRRIHSLH